MVYNFLIFQLVKTIDSIYLVAIWQDIACSQYMRVIPDASDDDVRGTVMQYEMASILHYSVQCIFAIFERKVAS